MRYILFFLLLISNSALAIDPNTYIPPKAFDFRYTIKREITNNFKELPEYSYIPALIEHESCISLTHSRCWSPTSRLKTAREEGAGLGQITKAWNQDGTIRFDSLKNMRDRYRQELKEASWETIYQRPDIQIRIIILMSRDNYKALYNIENEYERLAMADAAYNGGLTGVQKEEELVG